MSKQSKEMVTFVIKVIITSLVAVGLWIGTLNLLTSGILSGYAIAVGLFMLLIGIPACYGAVLSELN